SATLIFRLKSLNANRNRGSRLKTGCVAAIRRRPLMRRVHVGFPAASEPVRVLGHSLTGPDQGNKGLNFSSPTSQIAAPQGSVPEGTRIYAIGDVHGRLDLLESVLARIDTDMGRHPASNAIRIFLGDYIDRGPDSKRVLDRLVNCCVTQPTICLMGNHEGFLGELLKDPDVLAVLRHFGELETLLSL